jgi:uncharacterized protein (TIGR03083 family)
VTPEDIRACFAGAAAGFVELAGQVRPDQWDRPALGAWDVRALAGHTSRALSTIETYLGKPAGAGPVIDGPVQYFLAALAGDGPQARQRLHAAVASRGIEAGAALGDEPAAAIVTLTERVVRLVGESPDDAALGVPFGQMTLAGYLPTRTFELTVHSLDLSRALAVPAPAGLTPAITACCDLAGRLAGRLPTAADLLLLLTGRSGLPGHLTVL